MIKTLIEKCANAKHIMFITGAGISSSSGLPTYRGVGGLYSNKLIPPEIIMSKFMFDLVPWIPWYHFHKVIKNNQNVKHNVAHEAIAVMQYMIDKITVVTQNVDGLHSEAGSDDVIELHGNARRMKCSKCGIEHEYSNGRYLPRCSCGGIIRPDVILFGEKLHRSTASKYSKVIDSPDVVIGVGTSGNFPYILQAFERANFRKAYTALIDINFNENFTNLIDCWINDKAENALPFLSKEIWKAKTNK